MSRVCLGEFRRLALQRQFCEATLLSALFILLLADPAAGQSASAVLAGTVVDSTGGVLVGAKVIAVNQDTSTRRQALSRTDGSFTIATLMPGRYFVTAELQGFQPTEMRDVVLNVDDRIALRVEMVVADRGETVTIVSEAPRINLSSAVGTVIDRKFVENLPLNGRSFQALLQLTPGVVLVSPVSNGTEGGQFSINGQRAADNYFTIDGVSANVGASTSASTLGQAGSGQLPALTAQGGTNGLVSVDALQEFRIQTSGYAPEFGRSPGGQISLVTRAGTNAFHGSAFEYFRHDALDSTDWFVKRSGEPEAKLRQHNFGGVLGGPIVRNKTFAFGSYEGLRLLLPQSKTVAVPTVVTRDATAPSLRPYIDTLPLPNGTDLGNGFANFVAIYSDPSHLDSTSVRVDHNAGATLKIFARGSDAPSFSETRGTTYSYASVVRSRTSSGTVGITWFPAARMVHDLRVNYTTTKAPGEAVERLIGGAKSFAGELPSRRDPSNTGLSFILNGGGRFTLGPLSDTPERQFNLVDSLTLSARNHDLKFGLDYRRITATAGAGLGLDAVNADLAGLPIGRAAILQTTYRQDSHRTMAFDNVSLYAQDHWRATSRLTLSYGIRWDVVPPPEITSGVNAVTLERTTDLLDQPVGLAPPGTPLWKVRYNNIAPRLGGSYLVSGLRGRYPLVLRGGYGVFYGLGYGLVANAAGYSYPFSVNKTQPNVTFPPSEALVARPDFGVDPPGTLYVMDRELQQPYTVQWNVSAEQGIGAHDSVSISYVGANGHDLLRIGRYIVRLREWPNASTQNLFVTFSEGQSDYHALQAQFRRRLSRGLQSILSYTLSRSRDTESTDTALTINDQQLPAALDYGYSSFDVRHVFSAALTYQVSAPAGPRMWRTIAQDWGVDLLVRLRSAFPLEVSTSVPLPPATASVRPNVVPGEPIWVDDATVPGGRRLNRLAFATPAAATQGDFPRGSVRGFGLSQVDLALRRELPLANGLRLQLRIEAFNLLNTPNFADPSGTLSSANFGVATQMLNRGLRGQNALYQMGGPRSIQIATKILF